MLFKVDKDNNKNSFEPNDLDRHTVVYQDASNRFYEASRDFSKQYAHIYSARLNIFRNILKPIIEKRWSNKYKVLKLCDLRDKGSTCVIIGTIFKMQELKPSILKELSDQLEIIPQPARTHFVHETDSLVLEDELQRIKLSGDCINVNEVVTGVVAALLGSEDDDGIFTIKDVCWAGCNVQKPLPKLDNDRNIKMNDNLTDFFDYIDATETLELTTTRFMTRPRIYRERPDYFSKYDDKDFSKKYRYIVLMSGLNLASKSGEHLFPLNLFLEWLSGFCGTSQYQEEVSKIIRVIIAGGIYANANNENVLNESDVIASSDVVDSFSAAISAVAPLDLMPGSKDPTGIMLPQKPFHYCLFPKAIEYKSFNRVSNPYECDIGGFICLGTSGEPIKDIMKYSNLEHEMDVLKKTLEWRHIAPTCPDNVPCTPCLDTDPFTMYNCPAVYFSGNCNEFATDLYKGEHGQLVRIICVPDFCSSKSVVLVNLSNLDCYTMSFT